MRHNSKLAVSLVAVSLAACFALGAAFHKYAGKALRHYLGVSGVDFINSPGAVLRIQQGAGMLSKPRQYTRDHGGVYFRRYVETGLLPLVMDGKRLSDSYPVPKNGGAITSVGSSVIILDRLGGLYSYDRTADLFAPLQIPRLPNNLEAYVHHRPDSRYDLTAANSKYEFAAYDIVFLSDRNELAVSYDKFDETRGNLRTAVSVSISILPLSKRPVLGNRFLSVTHTHPRPRGPLAARWPIAERVNCTSLLGTII